MLLLNALVNTWPFRPLRRYHHLLLPLLSVLLTTYTPVANANINGSDTQNFNPTASGTDFVTVSSSRTLGTGNFSLGLFIDYAVNTLPYFSDSAGPSNDNSKGYNDAITSGSIQASVGILPFWDLGISIPGVINQSVNNKQDYHGQFETMGVTDIRLSSKFNLWHNDASGLALLVSSNFNQIEHNPYSGLGSQPIINAELIADTRISDFTFSVNGGYRFRKDGNPYITDNGNKPIDPVTNEIIASGAIQYQIPDTKAQLIVELFGSKPGNDFSSLSARSANILECSGGMRYYYTDSIALHIGAGSELIHSLSSPDFRVYSGITWTPKPELKSPKPVVAPPPPPVVEARVPDKIYVIRDILFKFNSSDINQNVAHKSLSSIGDSLIAADKLDKLVIEGHTCSMGTDKYNDQLSQKRAASIKEWLIKRYHIPAAKIVTTGFGKSRPIATNKTPQGRKLNRRVEFKIYYHQQDNTELAHKTANVNKNK